MRLVGLIIIPGAFFLVGLTIIFFADDSCLCRAWPLVAPNEGRGSGENTNLSRILTEDCCLVSREAKPIFLLVKV